MLRVILAAWMLAAAASAAQVVEGHVVNSVTGADIAGAAVRLRPSGDSGAPYSATTDSQGRFSIAAVKDGTYTAFYMAPNFWPVPGFLGASPPFQVAAGGDAVRLDAQLQPIPKLSGRVLDAAGKPVPNATVWLLWESPGCGSTCFPFTHQTKSDAKGEYTLGDPDVPGTWLLSATAPSSWRAPEPRDGQPLGWAQTFYPGVADSQLAERIQVQPGSEFGNLDVKLAAVPVHRVRGVVLNARGDPVPKASVDLAKAFGPTLDQETEYDGSFEFEAVTEGEWRVSTTVDQDGVKLRGGQAVRIGSRDLEDVELRLAPPFSIRGKVVMEVPAGAPAPKAPTVMLAMDAGAARVNDNARILSGVPDAMGDVTIRNVYPGPYQVLPGAPPAPYYLDSVRIGSYDALSSGVSIVKDAQPLTIAYKVGGGTVRGTIEGCGGGRVMLIPHDPGLRRGPLIRSTGCAQNGRFEFDAVRPGEYYGVATADDSDTSWYGRMLDDGVLTRAARVTVRGNEAITAEIRLIRWQ